MTLELISLIGMGLDLVGFFLLMIGWANPMPYGGFGDEGTGIDDDPETQGVLLWEKRGTRPYLKQTNRVKQDFSYFIIFFGIFLQLIEKICNYHCSG